jgi:hypothetical protein
LSWSQNCCDRKRIKPSLNLTCINISGNNLHDKKKNSALRLKCQTDSMDFRVHLEVLPSNLKNPERVDCSLHQNLPSSPVSALGRNVESSKHPKDLYVAMFKLLPG